MIMCFWGVNQALALSSYGVRLIWHFNVVGSI